MIGDLSGEANQRLGTPHADKFDLVFGLFFSSVNLKLLLKDCNLSSYADMWAVRLSRYPG